MPDGTDSAGRGSQSFCLATAAFDRSCNKKYPDQRVSVFIFSFHRGADARCGPVYRGWVEKDSRPLFWREWLQTLAACSWRIRAFRWPRRMQRHGQLWVSGWFHWFLKDRRRIGLFYFIIFFFSFCPLNAKDEQWNSTSYNIVYCC